MIVITDGIHFYSNMRAMCECVKYLMEVKTLNVFTIAQIKKFK